MRGINMASIRFRQTGAGTALPPGAKYGDDAVFKDGKFATLDENKHAHTLLEWVGATCNSYASTKKKNISVADYVLSANTLFVVTFAHGNDLAEPEISVNGGTAFPVSLAGGAPSGDAALVAAGGSAFYFFDGASFAQLGSLADTAYEPMSVLEGAEGLSDAPRVIRADYLKEIIAEVAVTLGTDGKVPIGALPDFVVGQLLYAGTFDPVSGDAELSSNAQERLGTNDTSIALTDDASAVTGYAANEGNYYVVSGEGVFASVAFEPGDWLIATASGWQKIDNTDAVVSVNGRIGAIVLDSGDVGIFYGVCATEGNVAEKAVACTGFAKKTGARVVVKFAETNTEADPLLNVGGTGAEPIFCNGAAVPANWLEADGMYEFVFGGSGYDMIGNDNDIVDF